MAEAAPPVERVNFKMYLYRMVWYLPYHTVHQSADAFYSLRNRMYVYVGTYVAPLDI